jgi:serine/threonine-protein kinase
LDRLVALKMLIAGPFASAGERARLIKEAQAVAQLRHANIVRVFDVGEFDGRPYFTMELIEGKTLAQEIAGTPQPAARAARITQTLSIAIEFAHQAGIIHRDLKPSNILLAPDGAPMITDFGLARHVQNHDALTLHRMGTPSYMAPEHYLAGANSPQPTADVYSLGAILYEMLTGRPPFRGESAAETQRQLLTQDPVPPSRFNKPVPRDLETICLMCLRKDPLRRYPTAAALAEDLRRFHSGEPIQARRAGPLERTTKWIHRHPSLTIAIVSGFFAAVVTIAAASWLVSQSSARNRGVSDELNRAYALQHQGQWKEADTALDRASVRLGDHGPLALRVRLSEVRADSQLAARLNSIADDAAYSTSGVLNLQLSAREYQDAFEKAGMFAGSSSPSATAARMLASNISGRLIDSLYDWSFVADENKRKWLWKIICETDHDATGWRDRIRDRAVWEHASEIAKAADGLPVAQQRVAFCLAVSHQLDSLGQDALPFLFRLQDAHPQDFWANLSLADRLREKNRLQDAVRFYQAAITVRPTAAIARHNLGLTLIQSGQHADAIAQFRHALEADPRAGASRTALCIELISTGHFSEAIEPLRVCVHDDPNNFDFHRVLGKALETSGDLSGAAEEYRHALALQSNSVEILNWLRDTLVRQEQNDEALAVWQKSLQVSSAAHDQWDGYAEFCLFLGRQDLYRTARTDLLSRFGQSTDRHICERVGRACLLLPGTPQELTQATALIDRAISQEQSNPTGFMRYFKVAKSLADYRAGDFSSAIKILDGDPMQTLGPAPGLILAMAEFKSGDTDSAHDTLEKAITSFNWTDSSDAHDYWIYSMLRAEAERLIAAADPTHAQANRDLPRMTAAGGGPRTGTHS